MSEKLSICLW